MKKLLDKAYGEENPTPPSTHRQEAAPTYQPYTGEDEMPVIRAVDLVLSQAIAESVSQIWVLPRPEQLLVLARKHDGWSVWMTPTRLLHTQIIARLKRLADLIVNCQTVQQSNFQANGRNFKLETHLSENGEEAFLSLLD
jgi:type II secretory ATPase GspE/PulE/Tfp pilus assembly ATPase PilB-like protein